LTWIVIGIRRLDKDVVDPAGREITNEACEDGKVVGRRSIKGKVEPTR
jgi:hypothetical protein